MYFAIGALTIVVQVAVHQAWSLVIITEPEVGVIGSWNFTIQCTENATDIGRVYNIAIEKWINGSFTRLASVDDRGTATWTRALGGSRVNASGYLTPSAYIGLFFDEIRCHDEGTYRCIVNAQQRQDEVSKVVEFMEKPNYAKILVNNTLAHSPVVGDVGDMIHLSCDAEVGKPNGNITWYVYRTGEPSFSVFDSNITMSDYKHYQCWTKAESEFDYIITAKDHGLVFRCDVENGLAPMPSAVDLAIMVEGLEITSPTLEAHSTVAIVTGIVGAWHSGVMTTPLGVNTASNKVTEFPICSLIFCLLAVVLQFH